MSLTQVFPEIRFHPWQLVRVHQATHCLDARFMRGSYVTNLKFDIKVYTLIHLCQTYIYLYIIQFSFLVLLSYIPLKKIKYAIFCCVPQKSIPPIPSPTNNDAFPQRSTGSGLPARRHVNRSPPGLVKEIDDVKIEPIASMYGIFTYTFGWFLCFFCG